MKSPLPRSASALSLRIVLVYVALGAFWIFFSDRVLIAAMKDGELLARWSLLKGFAFVTLTGLCLFFLLRWTLQKTIVARDAAELSSERLRLAMEAAQIGDWELDFETGEIRRSLIHDRIFGYETLQPTWTFETFWQHLYADDREEVQRIFDPAGAASNSDRHAEFRIVRADGVVRHVWARATIILDSAGKPLRMVGVIRDRTDTARADEKLRLNSEALEYSLNAFDIVDENGRFVYVNQAFLKMWGYQRKEEIVDRQASEFCADPSVTTRILNTLREKGECRVEFTGIRRDGSELEVLLASRLFRPQGGRQLAISTSLDITERRRAESELRLSEARLLTAQRVANLGSWDVDFATKEIHWSDHLFEMFGLQQGQFRPTRETIMERVHPQDRARVEEEVLAVWKAGRRMDSEHRIVLPDGSVKVVHALADAVENERGELVGMSGTVLDITARYQAETRARELAARLTTTLESITEAFFTVDREWRINYVNKSAQILFRRSEGSVLGKNLWEEYPNLNESAFGREYRRAVESNIPVHFEEYYAAMNLWLEVNAYPSPQGLAVYIRDVTTQHLAREALRESEERFRAVFEQAPLGIFQISREGQFEQVNPRFCQMLGYSAEELMRLRFSDVTYPEDVFLSEKLADEIFGGKREGGGIDKRYVRQDGGAFWAHSTVAMLRGEDGRPRSVVTIVEDINARKEAEEKLHFQAHILNSIGEAVIATTPDGRIIYFNRFAETLYGWSAAEAVGRNVMEVTVPEVSRKRGAEILADLQSGGTWTGEVVVHRRNGSKFLASVTNAPLLDRDGKLAAIIGISMDITDRAAAEKERLLANEQLRALSSRMESLREEERTRISREIHDELGQMLTGIKIDLTWLEHRIDKAEDPRLHPLLERIVSATELADTTLRAVQRIAADLRPSVLDKLGLIAALKYEGRRFQERTGILCEVYCPEDLPAISPEATTGLFRVFQECLTNVARHSGATRINVTLERSSGDLCLSVEDNGQGMALDSLNAPSSLGVLGMRERVALLGGSLSFLLGKEGGTIVSMRVPESALANP